MNKNFRDYLRSEGLKSTRQREVVVELFLQADKHYSVEDLHHAAQREDKRIGYSTAGRSRDSSWCIEESITII
jgi:Fur family ferric uptake transcriptional regulator